MTSTRTSHITLEVETPAASLISMVPIRAIPLTSVTPSPKHCSAISTAASRSRTWWTIRILQKLCNGMHRTTGNYPEDCPSIMGCRFSYDIPQAITGGQGAVLHFNLYSPSSSPVLFQPVLVNGERMMENPLNGEIFPSAYLDYYVPGSGTIAPGTVTVGSPDWRGIFHSRHVVAEPRFGFAYDLFGDGKTAIRGGVGRFVAMRTFSGSIFGYIINPPSISYPTSYYGKVTDLSAASGPAGTSIYELWESQREVALFVLLVAWRSASRLASTAFSAFPT